MGNKSAKIRIAAFVFLLYFFVVSGFSNIFISTHKNHKHDFGGIGGSCTVCAQIKSAENILKQFNTALICASIAVISLCTSIGAVKAVFISSFPNTPVKLKIRMNN